MVTTEEQGYTIGDERLRDNLGEFHDLRKPHLEDLREVEVMVRQRAPLPTTYDVNRNQPQWFQEFTHTECLGGLLVTPQSGEAAARMVQIGVDERSSLDRDPTEWIMDRLERTGTLDKYRLQGVSMPDVERVVFTPGSNLFTTMVSREILTRAMWEDDDLFIKPHPMTNEGNMRMLCREFGYHRIIPPMESGWEYLRKATVVYATSSTELALYAVLLGKEVRNISNFFHETMGVYHPLFRLRDRGELVAALSSPYSGFIIPGDDPNRVDEYFRRAMELRRTLRPLTYEMGPVQWADSRVRTQTDAVR